MPTSIMFTLSDEQFLRSKDALELQLGETRSDQEASDSFAKMAADNHEQWVMNIENQDVQLKASDGLTGFGDIAQTSRQLS